jgi:hypothetical protein
VDEGLETLMAWRCFDCNMPDPYNGAGDGIGSCDCPRCEDCGAPPGGCNGHDDWDDDEGDDPYAWTPCGQPGCACQVPVMVTVRTVLDAPTADATASGDEIAAIKRREDR